VQAKVLPLKTIRNPRDLGGYLTQDGHKVKMQRLLRTGRICNLSRHDQQYLINYGLRKVIDLRSEKERKQDPDTLISGTKHFNISISPEDNTEAGTSFEDLFKKFDANPTAAFEHMRENYRLMITRPHSQRAFHRVLEEMANTPEGAIIFHCSEGKDRTGLTTFFILYILGVDLETIRQDYLFSNYMLNDYRARRDLEAKEKGSSLAFRANLRSLGSVADEYLDNAIITMCEEYGGIDSYIKKQLAVSDELIDLLRKLYLE
jgi:protein-tyrosine phosphatase (fragment)